jgi:hypothetical protein
LQAGSKGENINLMKISRRLFLETLLWERCCPECFGDDIVFSPQSTGWEVIFKCNCCGCWDTLTWVEINECGGKFPQQNQGNSS